MTRQSTIPVNHPLTRRTDNRTTLSSGEVGEVVPVSYAPLFRGDSCSGQFGIDVDLAEMDRPLMAPVFMRAQAWFVPKLAFPQFNSFEEFQAAYNGTQIKALNQPDRNPPPLPSHVFSPGSTAFVTNRPLLHTLGVHAMVGENFNMDLLDAYNVIWNFRRRAYSDRIPRRQYTSETHVQELAPAFWHHNQFSNIVPSYERALVVGDLSLDVLAGQVPITGIRRGGNASFAADANLTGGASNIFVSTAAGNITFDIDGALQSSIVGELTGQELGVSLANIDKARELQAFAKLRAAYAGSDPNGFVDENGILSDLMRGFKVPDEEFQRPWLLDNQMVTFGMVERHATDSLNLEDSITVGRASATLNINVPQQHTGGYVLVTIEVMPQRIDERQGDPMFYMLQGEDYPDALRDTLNEEPVDTVPNWRIDSLHTNPQGVYGYEPMNYRHMNREFTALGGAFYQPDPANPWSEQRSAIWLSNIVDRDYTEDHHLCPVPFPKYPFRFSGTPAFEFSSRHSLTVTGLTQFGDVLNEDNAEFADTSAQSGA